MVLMQNDVESVLIEKLAWVRGRDEDQIRVLVQEAGGDLELDSKEGQTVAVMVGLAFGAEDLIRPEDQKRENLTSIGSLRELLEHRLRERESE